MSHQNTNLRGIPLWLALSVALTAFLEALCLAMGTPFSWGGLASHLLFVAALLFAATRARPDHVRGVCYVWPWTTTALLTSGAGVALVYGLTGSTWAAWMALAVFYYLLSGLDVVTVSRQKGLRRWGMRCAIAVSAGTIPVAVAQVESQFADEEFFVALQAAALSLFWVAFLVTRHLLAWPTTHTPYRGLRVDRRWLALVLVVVVSIGAGATVRAYQRSFYPHEAPGYESISDETPFICGKVPPDSQIPAGEEVFRRLLTRVEQNPHKGPPEYGMLAIGTGEQRWAEAFRESIMDEAARGLYTGRANSVKWGQHEAALRAYYFPRVQREFPDLFSNRELALLEEWFAAINRRAMTVEWVDWLYGLAYAKRPEGPYENQENGAGLLSLLSSEGLEALELSSDNEEYLTRIPRGWENQFRVTDDALIYQPEWITNAHFQALDTGVAPMENRSLSFEWLLLQALPDGAPLRYNHPIPRYLAGIAYLGARLTEDPRYVWLASRALANAEKNGEYLSAQPGAETPVSLSGYPPTLGSCLLYGDSGLPNQMGPLAPDKIVFRDGWAQDSAYLLLNLRFTGWHRYKASNTITLVYQKTHLVTDALDGVSFGWLPEGRSMFRDKRIPRENLNGLLVERTGMSAVLHALTGVGSSWAQDPPRYAEVVTFETGDNLDWSHTRLVNWRGWQHDRQIYFYHRGGPIVVVDEAIGARKGQAAVAWHFTDGKWTQNHRIRFEHTSNQVEVVLVPMMSEGQTKVTTEGSNGGSDLRVVYYGSTQGKIKLATLFLTEPWTDAEVTWDEEAQTLELEQESGDRMTLPFSRAR